MEGGKIKSTPDKSARRRGTKSEKELRGREVAETAFLKYSIGYIYIGRKENLFLQCGGCSRYRRQMPFCRDGRSVGKACCAVIGLP